MTPKQKRIMALIKGGAYLRMVQRQGHLNLTVADAPPPPVKPVRAEIPAYSAPVSSYLSGYDPTIDIAMQAAINSCM